MEDLDAIFLAGGEEYETPDAENLPVIVDVSVELSTLDEVRDPRGFLDEEAQIFELVRKAREGTLEVTIIDADAREHPVPDLRANKVHSERPSRPRRRRARAARIFKEAGDRIKRLGRCLAHTMRLRRLFLCDGILVYDIFSLCTGC
ncbi:hypothetical protein EVJ58_g8414 [Rhodofomes roseus]|uniref:Uncharacterized protein n=1 Tax=Rhodofomes roseus TaxID=34475 RepID=A0A4Y9Y1B6_9APHY|nr:hypothetical protein EVJ58_g8414 [Rhodofomes roseus]